ncbi:hypothetical protein V2J09_014164 [Rumex salicifolius]
MDVVDFVINKGYGVRGLSKMGLKSVPEIYVQPPQERFDSSKVVLDVFSTCPTSRPISESERGQKERVLPDSKPRDTRGDVGGRLGGWSKQPTEDKVVYKTTSIFHGSATFGTSFRPEAEKVFEWKDFLNLRYISDEDAALSSAPICKYRRKKLLLMGATTIHYNCYPPCPNPELIAGVTRHLDISCLTVLLQDDVGGLYVRAEDGGESRVYVLPTKGALVINVGDTLQILNNGQYKSIERRVEVNSDQTRISLASFISPLPNLVVGPLPEVLVVGETLFYREVLFGDYLKYFLSKAHDGKTTIDYVKLSMGD